MRDCSLVVCDRQADGETPLLTGSHGDFLHLLDRVARGFNAREIASFAGVTDESIHCACFFLGSHTLVVTALAQSCFWRGNEWRRRVGDRRPDFDSLAGV